MLMAKGCDLFRPPQGWLGGPAWRLGALELLGHGSSPAPSGALSSHGEAEGARGAGFCDHGGDGKGPAGGS